MKALYLLVLLSFALLMWQFKVSFNHEKVYQYNKVVSLAPSMTETVLALNEAERLVGITSHCPKENLSNSTIIGSFAQPNFESIMSLNPDLVLAVPHVMVSNTLTKLKESGIKVFSYQPDSLEDIAYITKKIARFFGVDNKGEVIIKKIDQTLKDSKNILYSHGINNNNNKVLIAIAPAPFVVAGNSSFPSQIIEILGLHNLAITKNPWPVWPIENLFLNPPNYLLLANGGSDVSLYKKFFSNSKERLQNSLMLIPKRPIFNSPSPIIIEDIKHFINLFKSGV